MMHGQKNIKLYLRLFITTTKPNLTGPFIM